MNTCKLCILAARPASISLLARSLTSQNMSHGWSCRECVAGWVERVLHARGEFLASIENRTIDRRVGPVRRPHESSPPAVCQGCGTSLGDRSKQAI